MNNAPTRRAAILAGIAVLSPGAAPIAEPNLRVAIFSKHLQFLQGEQLADAAAEVGFDGIDLTVRKGGHVDPARAAEDLPPLVSVIRRNGLDVPMITTDIIDADTPNVRTVLKTIANLEIPYYRWGGFKYQSNQPVRRQFEAFRRRSAQLAALNNEYKVCAMYHTHSGVDLVGAPVWDIFQVVDGLDPRAVGINYDIGHATVEGGLGGWIDSFRISQSYIRGVAFKDFVWRKNEQGTWDPAWVPLGQGMVRFNPFCFMLAQAHFNGPVQLHFEYPLGGANNGDHKIGISRDEVLSAMRRDLLRLRAYLNDAGLLRSHA